MDDHIIENLLKDKDSKEFQETLEKIRKAKELFEKTKNSPKPIQKDESIKDTITYGEFEKMKPKVGLYGFVNAEHCSSCSEYLKNMKYLGSLKKELTVVYLFKENQAKVKEQFNITVPFTRIYDGTEDPIWEREGILYNAQFESLFKAYKSIRTHEPIHTMEEFKLFEAKQKPLKVQVFEATEYINLDICGKHIVAREGQMVVYWPNTTDIKVMDKEEFSSKFEAP